jgi:two-component system response regulator (stage 0 sporulation protein F)
MTTFEQSCRSGPGSNRQRCWKCPANLINEPSVGGILGNKCIQCFCDGAKIDKELFLEAIANRRCHHCGWDLAIEPAIVEDEIGDFDKVLLCFRCRWGRDFESDQVAEELFQRRKRLYEEQYAEWQALCTKQESWWRMTAVLIGALMGATFVRNPTKLKPPTSPQSKTPALCGHPQLLFDGNKKADLTPGLVYYYPLELFTDSKSRNPPDWKERSYKCKQRDQFCCALCGKKRILVAHHVIPKYERGSHSLQNLITLCAECHDKQKYYGHDKVLEQIRAKRGKNPRRQQKDKLSLSVDHLQIREEQLQMNFSCAEKLSITRPPKIVIVEDEDCLLEMLGIMILDKHKSAIVQKFQDSNEAWQELLREDPDILIIDDKMPGLTGEDIVRRLIDRKAAYPIIVVSGWGPTEEWARAYTDKKPNITFLGYPFTVEQLYESLSKYLG